MRLVRGGFWLGIGAVGGMSFFLLVRSEAETVSALHLLVAAVCGLALGYRFYSRFLAARVLNLDDRRMTPAVRLEDGRDFVPTNRWVVFGHHFAAIAGPGPLVGPTLAAQFGFLPGAIWILVGVVLGGAVQDFVILTASLRRDGRSLASLARHYLGPWGALAGTLGILAIIVILIAVLGLVVVNALAESPWGLFTVASTIPIAMLMGLVMKGQGGHAVKGATALGLALLAAGLWGGLLVSKHPTWGPALEWSRPMLALAVIAYGLAASILPMWLLLAPRDYLSTFVKLGTVVLLAVGVAAVRPELRMPAFTAFVDGGGPIIPGKLFPFCFITIACGAISGFHALVASGTTPKLLVRETDARMVGYGSMLLEALVAILALVAAASLPPGQYFAINSKRPLEWIAAQGYPVSSEEMAALAADVGEKTVQGRAGGAPCLAVGMASIFHRFTGGVGSAVWYHFALMFEALFILTTLDAGTRVGRYLLQDAVGRVAPRLSGTGWGANLATSTAFVAAWGWFLWAGVVDPHGGVQMLWPLFGLSNQLLATTALAVGTTILVRTGRGRWCFVTLVPMAALLVTTFTAGLQLVFHESSAIGFLARAATPELAPVDRFNARLAGGIALAFLALVSVVVASAARQWIEVARGRRAIEPDAPLPQGLGAAVFGEVPAVGGRHRCC